jgi:hypothetical protein
MAVRLLNLSTTTTKIENLFINIDCNHLTQRIIKKRRCGQRRSDGKRRGMVKIGPYETVKKRR